MDLLELNRWIGNLVWEENANNVYRMKGVVSVQGEDVMYSLQVFRVLCYHVNRA